MDSCRHTGAEQAVAIVTGGNNGLGYATAKALADDGAHVVLAVRDLEMGRTAVDSMHHQNPLADCAVQKVDLAALNSVCAAAQELKTRYPRIDLLINNAGVCWTPYMTTADGFELQFGANHLGHSHSPAYCWNIFCQCQIREW